MKRTTDFEINGDGSNANWNNSDWLELPKSGGSVSYQTKVKMLYSDSGIYCLYHCEDNKITATLKEDFLDLWNEDVVEAFFWTDESNPSILNMNFLLSIMNYPFWFPTIKENFLDGGPGIMKGTVKQNMQYI